MDDDEMDMVLDAAERALTDDDTPRR